MRFIKICLLVLITINLASCGSSKTVSKKSTETHPLILLDKEESKDIEKEVDKLKRSGSNLNQRTIAYVSKYSAIAMEEMRRHKIPASITLAQGILESGNGVSQLSLKSNNHFGVKCHVGWSGDYVRHDDDEKQECFRKYKYVESSYEDHSLFLTSRSRYNFLFNLDIDDYKAWAKGLKKAGYATDPKYPDKLITLIERYNLDNYDKLVLKKRIKDDKKKPKGKYIEVDKGDTLYSISRKYKLSVDELKKMNGLRSNIISIGQELRVK